MSVQTCPICDQKPVINCKCPMFDARCQNGHEWHTCQVHFVIVPKAGLHGFTGCSCPVTPEIQKTYDEHWKSSVEKFGELDKDSVMRELSDYHFLLEMVPLVYDHVTNGRISKPNTHASAVKSQHDDCVQDAIEEAEKDLRKDLLEAIKTELEVYRDKSLVNGQGGAIDAMNDIVRRSVNESIKIVEKHLLEEEANEQVRPVGTDRHDPSGS